MKKAKTLLSVVLSAVLLFSLCAPSAVFSATVTGDVDGSGEITPGDARLALRISLGLMKDGDAEMTPAMVARADVDGKDGVQPGDARLILRKSLGIDVSQEGWVDSADPGEVDYSEVKFGVLLLHDENDSRDLGFINAAGETCAALGIPAENCILKTGVDESSACTDPINDLVAQGCAVIFGTSYGYEPYMIEAAKTNPGVQFCHISGTGAVAENLANYHNANAAAYEGRYLSGIAAGMKLNEMIESGAIAADETPLVGFVGTFTYAEVVSAYTAFFLGVRSVCPAAEMEVQFTGAWYNELAEKDAAAMLISRGADLISQYSDSMGAPAACEEAGVPNVTDNGSTLEQCPGTFLVSACVNWAPCFEYAIGAAVAGEAMAHDWTGDLKTGSVYLTDLNPAVAAEGTAEAIETAKAALIAGTLHVFDTSKFTVEGAELTSYMADVISDLEFTPDTEAVSDGYFHECEYRSAPYFDVPIDGIALLNWAY